MIFWLLLIALVLPAPAAEDYARFDLSLNRLMLRQAAVALEAGSVVEDWQSNKRGLTNQAALGRLEALLRQSEALVRELEHLTPPAPARTLYAAAVRAARARTNLIRSARSHVAQGNPSPQSQTAFMAKSLTATSELQARWLSDRLEAARVAPVRAARLREFYQWQCQMLPLTRTQVRVGSDVQKLVFASRSSNVDYPALLKEAGEATSVSFEVRDLAGAIQPPPALVGAHTRAREEQACLSELCAEVKAYAGEPAEEAVAKVRYAFRQLREASLRAEQASLDALAAALNAR